VESEILGFGIQNKVQGIRISLMIGIPNPSSTDKEFGRPCLESGIHGVESRIQNCHEEKSDLLKTTNDIAPQLQRLGILQTFET